MDNTLSLLKALADNTRFNIIQLLLKHNYCVGALARKLDLTEAAISQHLKILRETGLIRGKKQGYYVHYEVEKDQLTALGKDLLHLAKINRKLCDPRENNCHEKKKSKCRQAEQWKGIGS